MVHPEILATPNQPVGTGVFTFYACVTIAAPRAAIWKALTDLPSYHLWNPYTPKIDGELKVGDMITLHYRPGTTGSTQQVPCRVLEIDEGKGRLVWRGCPKGIPEFLLCPEKVHVITEQEDGKCLVEIYETQGRALAHVVKWTMGETLMKYQKGMCECLKKYVEEL